MKLKKVMIATFATAMILSSGQSLATSKQTPPAATSTMSWYESLVLWIQEI